MDSQNKNKRNLALKIILPIVVVAIIAGIWFFKTYEKPQEIVDSSSSVTVTDDSLETSISSSLITSIDDQQETVTTSSSETKTDESEAADLSYMQASYFDSRFVSFTDKDEKLLGW